MPNVYMIGNAHLDPVWLWRWQDGFSEILATYRSALDRLYEFPETKFTSACAVYYQWIEKMDPGMFAEIQEMVKAGRWEITGGWFLQPDCNIPDGESYMRHMLIAQRYFKEKFGVTARTGYNVDTFGHNGNLPKILRAGGMDRYVFMRPSAGEQGKNESLFHWESDDGSRVCTFRIPIRYNLNGMSTALQQLEQIIDKAQAENQDLMAFYGVGNHGGGPTIRMLDTFNRMERKELRYATTAEYFDKVEGQALPVITGELQHHARGCYTAETSVKKGNRKCEQNLLAAEVFSTMAAKLTGAEYPAKKLNKAWKNLLFAQFHDIMGGCCVKTAYDDTGYLLGETMSITEQQINAAFQDITWHIDTLQGETLPAYKYDLHDKGQWAIWEHEVLGTPVVVFNAHPWPVRQTVQVYAYAKKMTDSEGNEIPFQLVRGEHADGADKMNTAFLAEVPAMGYAVYRLFTEKESAESFASELKITERTIENSKILMELDPVTGDICRFVDKSSGKTLISKPCKAVLLDETACDTWAHDKKDLGPTVAEFTAQKFEVTEQGPVRASIRVTSGCCNSVIQRTYTVTAGSDQVTVQTNVDFREKHRALKFTFPLTEETVVAKIPYGTLTRRGYTGEEPCGSWIASGGLCVANDCKYGYDTQDGEMRMTVLRGAIYADHFAQRDEFCQYMEQGIHEFTYSLFPYTGCSASEKKAAELNFGLRRVLGSFHKGYLPEKMACIHVDKENVIVSAVKKAEDGDGRILRVYEMDGRDTAAQVRLFDKTVSVELGHNALKTYDENGNELSAMEWRNAL
ncbi:MAG: alpha-mannosidase [Oscillospiraceae bacterium]|nr:alpha-mannosidase [Oscillospiraceae bacterium]